jgi:Ribonucleotide reductase, beta subunit
MAYSTFSKQPNDARKEPMFFGQTVNVARYDQQKYEVFERLIEKQLSFLASGRSRCFARSHRLSGAATA